MIINRLLAKLFDRKFLTAAVITAFFAVFFSFSTNLLVAAQTKSDLGNHNVSSIFQNRILEQFVENGFLADKKTSGKEFVSPNVVISQVYGGGGNAGATYRNDFIELFNRGNAAVSLTGWSVQYFSAAGGSGGSTLLTGNLQPGQYYLIQEAAGTGGTANLPAPDLTGILNLSGTNGRVDLLNASSALVDRVAYGTATPAEGTATPTLTNLTSARRLANGCTDTDNNSADFEIITAYQPGNPRNTTSPVNVCGGAPTINLSINDVSVLEGNTGTTTATFTVTLTSPAPTGGVTFDIATSDGTATVADNDYVARSLTGQAIPAGSTTYTFTVTINGDTTAEPDETFLVNVTNVVGASVTDGQGVGTITNDDANPVYTKINEIQGSGNVSPIAVGTTVTTRGIVTARRSNGFFVQSQSSDVDADTNTSEGIFVFTSTAPPVEAALGNLVEVIGKVTEFIPSTDPTSPSITELNNVTSVTPISTGNALPAPVILTAADTNPAGGVNVLEKYEEMRVQVNSLRVVAPTDGNVNEASATATSNGIFFGVVNGVNRPFREIGLEILNPLPAGAPANIPRFDLNPERIRVNSFGQTGGAAIDVTTDATVTNLVGVLDYATRVYTILPDPAAPPAVMGNISAIPVPAPASAQMTVASFNLERFFDDVNDPAIGEPVLTTTAFNNRLNKASLAIRNVLNTPDVLAVVEMENLTTLQTLAAKINNDAVLTSQPNPNYQAYLVEGNDVGGIDVGFLVKSARITVVDVTQFGKTATYTNPNNGTQDLLNDRPPLVLRANVQLTDGSTFPFTVIANHLRSLLGIDDETPDGTGTAGGRVRAKRLAQAEFLANLVQSRQTADPNEKIIVAGDFNAFQFSDGYVDVLGTIKGNPAPSDQVVLASPDLVNPDLINLNETLPNPMLVATNQAYSYVFDGNAQAIDHVLITQNLQSRVGAFHYARLDADFPEIYRNDPNRPERISDHDAAVAYISLLGPTAAAADLSGRITNSSGIPLRGVIVTLTDPQTGVIRYGRTSLNGNYFFPQLQTGKSYVIAPQSWHYVFSPSSEIITFTDSLDSVNFTGNRP
jgi:predicted extracellular nuclease